MMKLDPSSVKELEKTMNEVEREVRSAGEASVDKVGRAMRDYARAVAPKDTKRLMRLIKYYKSRKGKLEGELVSVNPSTNSAPKGYQGARKKDFNLAYWFANSDRAVRHATHGYARYLDMAVKYGDKLFKGIVDRELDKRFK